MGNLAFTLGDLGRFAEAETLERQRFEISIRVLGKQHPSSVTAAENLAYTLRELGRHVEADELDPP